VGDLIAVVAVFAVLVLIVVAAYAAILLVTRAREPSMPAVTSPRDPALEALRIRLANGEIDEAEFDRLRSVLEAS